MGCVFRLSCNGFCEIPLELKMKNVLQKLIPSPIEMGREAIIVLVGVTVAAFVISNFPKWQKLIQDGSITVKDESGRVIF
jgi:hypothetical protein